MYITYAAIIAAFFMGFISYRKGLQDGLNIKANKPVEPIKNPVKGFADYMENRKAGKEKDVIVEGINNILSYTGEPQESDE